MFDFISSEHYAKSIYSILNDFCVLCEERESWPLFTAVVSDFSFANLHAIVKALNRITLEEYLQVCYDLVTGKTSSSKNFISVHLCYAHFIKMVHKDVDAACTNLKQRDLLKRLIAKCISMNDMNDISSWFYNIAVLLASPYHDEEVKIAYDNLINLDKEDIKVENDFEYIAYTLDFEKNNIIYKNTSFYKHFSSIIIAKSEFSPNNQTNPFFNKKLFDIILCKYMPYCPLWSCLILKITCNMESVSNAPVDNYFGHLKNNILNKERNLKCSRFVRKLREHVISMYKENQLDIEKTRLCGKKRKHIDASSEHLSQKQWKRKEKKICNSFSSRFIKSLSSNLDFTKVDSIEDFLKCIYCGKGRLSQGTDWVQCDVCKEWVHQKCESSQNNSYSGDFQCKMCASTVSESNITKSIPSVTSNLKQKCLKFLKTIDINKEEAKFIEHNTKDQRNSDLWRTERQKRITASFLVGFLKPVRCIPK